MQPERVELLLRKQRVQLRIERERIDLLALCAEMESAADGVEAGRRAIGGWVNGIRRNKLALGLVGTLLLLWRPVAVLRWARRAWLLYEAASRARSSGRSLLAAFQRRPVRRGSAKP